MLLKWMYAEIEYIDLNYHQKMMVSLAGYPRGYRAERVRPTGGAF